MTAGTSRPSVAIVGGGLAGLAAAVGLAEADCDVTLFEARRKLGGRATSYADSDSGELIDYCQHVSMGCCTNLADFCRRTGIDRQFDTSRQLTFIGPDNASCTLQTSRFLPAPAHLLPSLLKLQYLSIGERWQIIRGVFNLAATRNPDGENQAFTQWLNAHHQSDKVRNLFWAVVLVSALGESMDRVSVAAARKVFVDAFLAHRRAYEVLVPKLPLAKLFNEQVANWLIDRGVSLQTGQRLQSLSISDNSVQGLEFANGATENFNRVILALPWDKVAAVLPDGVPLDAMAMESIQRFESSPITGIHLWLDRPLTDLPHAVLPGRLSQWVFQPNFGDANAGEFYYQVVISCSRDLLGRGREEVARQVHSELCAVWPNAPPSRLLRWRVVTERHAVFSPLPGLESRRPPQQTRLKNLVLAGDWTATGWPSTMEGAVRGGYLAAEVVLKSLGRSATLLVDDLPRSWLVRALVGQR